MRHLYSVLVVSVCLIAIACGDDTEFVPDSGVDGQVITDGQVTPDGPVTDAPVVVDGPVVDAPADGPVTDGPGADAPADAPVTDGQTTTDGPTADGQTTTDGPTVLDGQTTTDGPTVLDGQTTTDGPTVLDGQTTADGPIAQDTGVDAPPDTGVDAPPPVDTGPGSDALPDVLMGIDDAGTYLCNVGGTPTPCACNDGIDNDADKKVDLADPGCLGPWDNSELSGTSECFDGQDNDGDGKIDNLDPECTGPLDNDEATFGTNIPGDNQDCKEDCFFDGNSGVGDDDCEWNLKCDPLSPGTYLPKNCDYDPKLGPWGYDAGNNKCEPNQSQACIDFCQPITPPGCDCFGCCEFVYFNGDAGVQQTVTVKLTASCDPSKLGDPIACPRCTQLQSCWRPCGPCDVCIGHPPPPPSCFPGSEAGVPDAGAPTCPNGQQYCGTNPTLCPQGTTCWFGCCIPDDILP